MTTQLEQLKSFTTIVADTGDFGSIKSYQPQDATTNPSLILKAVQMPEYSHILDEAIAQEKNLGHWNLVDAIMDRVLILFGCEILELIPGRVSTEIDASLSFDVQGSIEKAKMLIDFYGQAGIDRKRVLIKLASTWEGIQAAKHLEEHGIHCNLTLLFSLTQAIACADAGVTLISPFVGRILDWYKAKESREFPIKDDPGVQSVTEIFNYYKKFNIPTEVMGASFRSKEQVLGLAGCDLLTISPNLLNELKNSHDEITCKLTEEKAERAILKKQDMTEARFRWELNQNEMATDKLCEGIRVFHADSQKLRALIEARVNA